MENLDQTKYNLAKKRVKDLKGFYTHLTVYIVVNAFIIGSKLYSNWQGIFTVDDVNFLTWINWNVFGTTIIWGIGLSFHALSVFKHDTFKKWEERKINEFIEKENEKESNIHY